MSRATARLWASARQSWRVWLALAAVLVAGGSASLCVSSLWTKALDDAASDELHTRLSDVDAALRVRFDACSQLLLGARGLLEAGGDVSPIVWDRWATTSLGPHGMPGVAALGYLARDDRRMVVVRAASRTPTPLATGLDLADWAGMREAARTAIELDAAVLTPPAPVTPPGSSSVRGFLLLRAVRDGAPGGTGRLAGVRGWVVAVIDPGTLAQGLVTTGSARERATLVDDDSGLVVWSSSPDAARFVHAPSARLQHVMGMRRWTIRVERLPSLSPPVLAAERYGPLCTGLILTCGLALLLLVRARLGWQAEQLAQATARELQATEPDGDHMFDLSLELLAVLTRDGRVVRANASFARALGCASADLQDQPFVSLVVAEHRGTLEQALAQIESVGSVSCEDTRWARADGSLAWMAWTLTLAPSGHTVNAFGRDITNERETHEALERQSSVLAAQAMQLDRALERAESSARAKAAFFATVSHEVCTPMQGILGMAQMLFDSPLTAEQRESVLMIQSVAGSLLAILNDVLDLSRMESSSLSLRHVPLEPQAVVDDVLAEYRGMAGRRGVALTGSLSPGVPPVLMGDPERLRQLLGNLVSNALRFTMSGSVHVGVERMSSDGAMAELCFSVRDTGCGLTEHQMAHVFEPFWQAKSGGSGHHGMGLGLTICDRLARLMGGAMRVESARGQGSTFRFTAWFDEAAVAAAADTEAPRQSLGADGRHICLTESEPPARGETHPTTDAIRPEPPDPVGVHDANADEQSRRVAHALPDATVAMPSAPMPAPPVAAAAGDRVLVVEDNPVNQRVAVRFLQKLGCDVDVAEDGRQALDALAIVRYEVVFMDCQMPVMDGYEATRAIRAAERGREHQRIVALTANVMAGDRERCLQAGMDDFLPKPVRLDDLRAALARARRPQAA